MPHVPIPNDWTVVSADALTVTVFAMCQCGSSDCGFTHVFVPRVSAYGSTSGYLPDDTLADLIAADQAFNDPADNVVRYDNPGPNPCPHITRDEARTRTDLDAVMSHLEHCESTERFRRECAESDAPGWISDANPFDLPYPS